MAGTAILYTRVSTEERAKRGYSLGEQLHDLRREADRHGHTVLEEVEDPGYSRSTLNRPGMDRVRELVAGGGVDLVLAWKRDRYGAAPWPGVLEVEFAASGCALRALDDSGEGDDAEFMGGIKDLMAKRELRDMVRRTRMGKAGKAREGKVLGSGPPPYGYGFVKNDKGVRVGLAADEATMPVVRRLFELVGGRGLPMYAAGRRLEAEGHPAPKGGPWRVSVIKTILERDTYRPHTLDELRDAGVSGDVLARLDPGAAHGLHFSGKRRVTGPARGPRVYRKIPREEWIPVPVPDAGVPLAWVEAARESVRDNPRPAFGGGGRDHELAGGVLVCASCGHRMTTSSSKTGGVTRWYYSCPEGRGGDRRGACAHRRMHNAGALEDEVVALVDGELLTDRGRLASHLEAAIERERAASLGSGGRGLGAGREVWEKAAADAGREMDALVRLYTTGRLRGGEAEYDRRAAEIDARRDAAEGELARISAAGSRVAEMEAARRAVLGMWGTGLSLGVFWMPPRLRRQVYGLLGLQVAVDAGGKLTLEGSFDADLMRLTPEVEEWVAGLRAIDERMRKEHAADQAEALDRLEAELAGLRRRMAVRPAQATSG